MNDYTLAAIAVWTHGPLDVGITLMNWHLESNAVVLQLGKGPWIAVKAVLCLSMIVCTYATRGCDSRAVAACLWFLATLGVLVVLSNGLVILGGFH